MVNPKCRHCSNDCKGTIPDRIAQGRQGENQCFTKKCDASAPEGPIMTLGL